MTVRKNFVDSIGNTPLIRLTAASEATGCDIYGKAEFLNPGGSVKDRAALAIIKDAEKKGLLQPGGVIVEGTAGNTGIGLALVGNARGYKTIIVMPETQTDEKKALLKYCGADLRLVPAKPYKDPDNYIKYSGRLAEEIAATEEKGAIWANQFDNVANKQGHYETTGPEIWTQLDGKIDGFICAVGSGGTLAGTTDALRERNPGIKVGLADPMGAALFNYYKNGALKSEGSSISEGIGQGRITANLEGLTVDLPYQISDAEALTVLYDLNIKEGLQMGLSSGVNVAGAIRMAKEMGPGHTIVTILCDTAQKYFSKLMDVDMLRENNLPVAPWLEGNVS
ncbi:MAG: cysteine synthase A [Sneathiella sp.]